MTLLDTNVLIYAFTPGATLHSWAWSVLRGAVLGTGAAINSVVLAEYLVGEQTPTTATARLAAFGVTTLDLPSTTAPRCAQAFSCYLANRRDHAGARAPRTPLADFFIGAHAALLNLPLATADLDRYRTYFPEVQLISP